MKKNDNVNLKINNYGCNAEGVAKLDGEVIFVPCSLVGEDIDALIIKKNSKFSIAKIENIKSVSSERITPSCPYFSKCGGCQLQHTNYKNSLKIKTGIVQNAITNIGKIDYQLKTAFPSENMYHYRNKIALPINPKTKKLGMFRPHTHNIVDIDYCYLQKDKINILISIINKFLKITKNTIYDEATKKGTLKSVVAREIGDSLLVTIVINGDKLKDIDLLVSMLKSQFYKFGISINKNKLKNNVILTDQFEDIYGENQVEIEEFGIKYKISNRSFLQVNDDIKKVMYQKIFEEVKNNVVIDAYSGAGLLSAMISKKSKQVFGVEIVKPASELADKIKLENNIKNLTNINGDCKLELPKIFDNLSEDDKKNFCVVLDPPRKGCDRDVLLAITNVLPSKIIYMSCDPSTLARDLNILLSSKKYKVKFINAYDMFPQTKHIEVLAVLEKN